MSAFRGGEPAGGEAAVPRWRTPLTEQLALLRDAGRMGFWERDVRTGEGVWDEQLFSLFGFEPAPAAPPREAALARVHADDRARVREWIAGLARHPGRADVHFRITHPDGRERHVHSIAEVRFDAEGAPVRMVGVTIDDTERREDVRAERARNERLARAMTLAGVSVWHIDPQFDTVRFNTQGERYLGAEAGSMPLRDLRATLHPDDHAAAERATAEAAHGDRVIDLMARFRDDHGGYRTLLTRRTADRDHEGRLLGVTGVSLDVTQLVDEREQTMRLRERLAQVADAVGLGLWSREVDGAEVEWNAQMFRIHHRAPHEGPPALEEYLERHIHTLDRARMAREQRVADAQWTPAYESEFRIPTPDGGVRWIHAWTRRDVRDGRRVAFGIHMDITARRHAEEALRVERERMRFALRAAGVGLWERSIDGSPRYWSDEMYRLRGLDTDDPRPLSELVRATVHPQDRVVLDGLVQRHAADGDPYECEFRVTMPDGSIRWLATRGQVVRDANGAPPYLAGVNFDITERRHAEEIMRESQRLEQASRAKSEFMARMSHELRTPLNAVLGFSELLVHDRTDAPSARQRERLDRIRSAGEHLLALINEVLDLSSIEADTFALQCEAVPMDEFVRDAVLGLAPLAERQGVTLRAAPSLPGCVWADRRRLGQVLSNLVSNGIKYNRPGGVVEVGVLPRSGGRAQWGLIVRDSGRGLTAAQRALLFEPFERLGAEQRGIEGTGIGLTIVRQLVERLGGEIEVLSEPDVGSEFRVWLPATSAAPGSRAVAPEPNDAAPAGDAPPLHVLCIEDNPVNMMLVGELVALRPTMTLTTAHDGAQGIAAALENSPDLVLLDLQLPDMHGNEVLARLRREPRLARTRIVALSANAMPDDVRTALDAGFDDYWTKPIDIPRFLAGLDAIAAARARS